MRLGGVLVVAGALNMPDPAAAVRAVRAYRLPAEKLVGPVALGLPRAAERRGRRRGRHGHPCPRDVSTTCCSRTSPDEGGSGLTDEELVYGDWVAAAEDQAGQNDVTGTPTLLVAGEQLADPTPDRLTAAVTAAQQ